MADITPPPVLLISLSQCMLPMPCAPEVMGVDTHLAQSPLSHCPCADSARPGPCWEAAMALCEGCHLAGDNVAIRQTGGKFSAGVEAWLLALSGLAQIPAVFAFQSQDGTAVLSILRFDCLPARRTSHLRRHDRSSSLTGHWLSCCATFISPISIPSPQHAPPP